MHRSAALFLAAAFALAPLMARAESAVTLPSPSAEAPAPASGLETAVLAGGCFWGVQARLPARQGRRPTPCRGYAGGAQKDADYEHGEHGATGHAETWR